MTDKNGTFKVLTPEEREAALTKPGVPPSVETDQLKAGASLWRAGNYYFKNSSNLHNRAAQHGFRGHCRKAVVDGEEGYVVWWDRKSSV